MSTTIAVDDSARENLIPFRADNPIAIVDMGYDANNKPSVHFARPTPTALATYLVEYAPLRTVGALLGLTLLGYLAGKLSKRC